MDLKPDAAAAVTLRSTLSPQRAQVCERQADKPVGGKPSLRPLRPFASSTPDSRRAAGWLPGCNSFVSS